MNEPVCIPAEDGSCSICADEAIAGIVLSVDPDDGTARVELPAGLATVAVDLLDHVSVGDSVMVHMGFAISRVGRPDQSVFVRRSTPERNGNAIR